MGALISLFVSLIMITINLTLMMVNLIFSLLTTSLRLARPHRRWRGFRLGGRVRSKSGGTTVVVVVLLIMLVAYPQLAIVLGVIAGLVWLVSKRSQRYRTPTAGELAQQFENVRTMSGAQFEMFMANLFRAMGHEAAVLGGSGDQGVDILLTANGQRIAVQCKNYAKAVGNKPVQEVFAGARHHNCQHAWVVAPAGYTRGAFELARSVSVSLFDANGIRAWIKEADKLAAAPGTPSTEDSAPEGRLRSAINGRIVSDREAYDALLEKYEEYVELLDKLYAIKREHTQAYNLDSTVKDQWSQNHSGLVASIQTTLSKLDTLEGRNPDLATDERVARRAELAARQLELEDAGSQTSLGVPELGGSESSTSADDGNGSPPVTSRNQSNPRAEQDRKRYDRLLNSYLSSIESLENYRDLRDLGQVPPGSDVEKQWRVTLRMVNGGIRSALLEMDELEESNPLSVSDGRAQRRSELNAKHEEIKREIGA